ncbi:LPD29 domain-containing protein, partial [Serratia fonticola]|uniref:LPD29 domain-containing protein n=1 Tax=Serratia fonticola TaxID=47917 RepID=UPI0028F70751
MKIEKKPLSIFRDVQWQISDDVCSQREVDHLLFSALQEELREKQEKNSIKDAFNFEVKILKTLPEFSHLKMIDSNNTSVAVVVSSNIRFLLKKNFPTIRFSVKKTSYNSVSVRWEDGPRCEQVEEITSKFKSGYFNSMEDVYEYSESPFNAVYGGVNYVTLDRHY